MNTQQTESKTFKYLGHTFQPLRRFVGGEGQFHVISRRLNGIGIHNYSGSWDYEEFYKRARKVCDKDMDLFLMDGSTIVCPCTNELFKYAK